jgi:penicillin-binding protein 1C
LRAAATRSRSPSGATDRAPAQRRLLDPVAAWYVGNVMIGTPPPENARADASRSRPAPATAIATPGASGFDGKRTVGVWVGRPDGAPVPGLVGRTAAGPDPVRCVRAPRQPAGGAAEGSEGTHHGRQQRLPVPLQRFRPARLRATRHPAPRIMFPPNGARLAAEGIRDGAEDLRRRAAADLAGQRRAAPTRPASARCSSPPTGRVSRGSP